MKIRLEYSSIQGKFKLAQATDPVDTVAGYNTLCCMLDQDRANRFITAIILKHPGLAKENKPPYPALALLKSELILFIEEDLELLQTQMNQTYQRRKSLLKTLR